MRVIGPEPERDMSKREMRQSVPVRKCVPGEDQRIEEGVRYASVVGETRIYVDRGEEVGERMLRRRMGRKVGVER